MNIIHFQQLIEKQGVESALREYKGFIAWDSLMQICSLYTFSIDFLREMRDYLEWVPISNSMKLTEKVIEEFKEEVSWRKISLSQDLSEGFMRKWADRIDWNWVIMSQKLTPQLVEDYKWKLDKEQLLVAEQNMKYRQ